MRPLKWARSRLRTVRKWWFLRLGYHIFLIRHRNPVQSTMPLGPVRRCFVDVSVISRIDAATGIQRVVRSVMMELRRRSEGSSSEILFLYHDRGKYRILSVEGDGHFLLTGKAAEFSRGDIFLGLDYALDVVRDSRADLIALRKAGVRFWFLLHDLLPMSHSHLFSRPTVRRYRGWLTIIACLSEGFFCVSEDVRGKLQAVLRDRLKIEPVPAVEVIPMGWDLSSSCRTLAEPENFETIVGHVSARPTILMVGTIEPRKGHELVLASMDSLWRDSRDYNLVLVGAPGWQTEALQTLIGKHPEQGRRLFWLRQISDEAMAQLYRLCSGVVMASYAEGFGLPLVEAIGHGKPVLARDLPVFRPHEGRGVSFFPTKIDTVGLARAIEQWIERDCVAPDNFAHLLPCWADTASFIRKRLLQNLPESWNVG